jgi:hypothetical protein
MQPYFPEGCPQRDLHACSLASLQPGLDHSVQAAPAAMVRPEWLDPFGRRLELRMQRRIDRADVAGRNCGMKVQSWI